MRCSPFYYFPECGPEGSLIRWAPICRALILGCSWAWIAGPQLLAADTHWTQVPQIATAHPNRPGTTAESTAPPRDVFQVQPGFQVELLYTVPIETQGSWVCLALDARGRLIASDQNESKHGLYRITPARIGSDEPTHVEQLPVEITGAHGLLAAFDSLYIMANMGKKTGLYRAFDENHDDQYERLELLMPFDGESEHGPHALHLAPDGKSIYVVAGNYTKLPQQVTASRLPRNWDEDQLLPRQWDASGHAVGILAPGGWICRIDSSGRDWELVSSGYRNSYDMDVNTDGEWFTFDSDMEWDMGMPWYRPTRLCHATSGSEFGWRSGSGVWPTYYVDSLPPVIDVGPGSPTGVTFGYGAKFPARYQKALYLLDWTFGTIYAMHLSPSGSSYTAEREEFLSRIPLPLTDAVVGRDGALYFTVGGRGTQSALYRVTYVGTEGTDPVDTSDSQYADLRALRHQLEDLLAHPDPKQLDFIWNHLGHSDRHIRYAARLALEYLPVAQWQPRLAQQDIPHLTLIQAAVALARQGAPEKQSELLAYLNRIPFADLPVESQLDLLRAYGLAIIRLGKPSPADCRQVLKQLDAHFPASDPHLSRELCSLLVALDSPTIVSKALAQLREEHDAAQGTTDILRSLITRNGKYGDPISQMLANHPQTQNLHYAYALRSMRYGWTLEERREYLQWLRDAAQRSGGVSYQGFLKEMEKVALEHTSPEERAAIALETPPPSLKSAELPKPVGPGQKWTVAELDQKLAQGLTQRDFANGQRSFKAGRCIVCHRFDGQGGATGPDLTNISGRFSLHDVAEAIIQPSKFIPDRFQTSLVSTTEGQLITGWITANHAGSITMVIDPEDASKIVDVSKDQIEQIAPSPKSLMPDDLLAPLNEAEVLDLLAYLVSRGNASDPMFNPSTAP